MSELKGKSEESTKASNKLIEAMLLNSSIHCSYYACVQLMLHLLRSHFGKTELQVNNEGKSGSINENGFHNWLINMIVKEFARLDATDAAKFNTIINNLKFARATADYKNVMVSETQAIKANETSAKAKSLLLKCFQS